MMSRTISPPVLTTLRFHGRVLDDAPELLEASYRLRFRVYCRERSFLDASLYPSGLEIDPFDAHAVHVGAIDEHGALAGTARLVIRSVRGLPLFDHCEVNPEFASLCEQPTVAEVSRLSVSREYQRPERLSTRRIQGYRPAGETARHERRPPHGEVLMTITKALYHVSKALGVTHWLAATEKSLQRILLRLGLPFEQIGPEADYFGLVAPYLMGIRRLDRRIAYGDSAVLTEFTRDIESSVLAMRPSLADRWPDHDLAVISSRSVDSEGGNNTRCPLHP